MRSTTESFTTDFMKFLPIGEHLQEMTHSLSECTFPIVVVERRWRNTPPTSTLKGTQAPQAPQGILDSNTCPVKPVEPAFPSELELKEYFSNAYHDDNWKRAFRIRNASFPEDNPQKVRTITSEQNSC
eukprot:GHVU01142285.1.p2 GENE.GHVU01142285.1~~GHVU01142285.1.p2  ORF type:complete len:128 (-),score=10.76 GHVU01142285.1:164-547(-)